MSDRLPSLDLVAAEVAGERERQDRRSEALDTKAGIVLGFAGALAALASREEGGPAEAAVALAAVAAVLAVLAFLPRTYPTIEVAELRRRYLTSDERFTQLHVLDSKIAVLRGVEQVLDRKVRLVTWAVGALLLAALATALARIVGA